MAKKRNNVLVSGRSPVARDSGGTVVGFPDVCNTPTPNGQVPVPYPNIAKSTDLKNGSKSVLVNGAPVCLSTSELSPSTGDEAGTGGGLLSGKSRGAAHPVSYDFTVKIEGRPVVRNLDLFTLNDRNTAPFPILQDQEAPPAPAAVAEVRAEELPEEKCSYCGKKKHDFLRQSMGNNRGASVILRARILQGQEPSTHPWYAGPFSLAAHHLICSEAMDSQKWSTFCQLFGYDINCRENGVMLPMTLALACQLHVPLHRGDHSSGFAQDLSAAYVDAVKTMLRNLSRKIERGDFCAEPEALAEELHAFSRQILTRIAAFTWTLTSDGLDYRPGGNGCSGAKRIPDKQPAVRCPASRQHGLQHTTNRLLLVPGMRSLRVGE